MTQVGVINIFGSVTPPVGRFGHRYINVHKANGTVEWHVAPMTTEEAKTNKEQGINTTQRQICILQAYGSDKRQAINVKQAR